MRMGRLLAVAIVVGAAAWAFLARGVVWHAPVEPLRLGTSIWLGYEPLHVADAAGRLPPGLRLVELVSATQVTRAWRNGEIDAATVTLDEALRLAAEAGDVELVLVTDVSEGGDAIVGSPAITDFAALRGRRVGVERSATGAVLLARALQQRGLPADAVTTVPMTVNELEDALLQGQIDAAVAYEPVVSRLRARGGRVLFTSLEMPGEIVDVIVVRRDLHLTRDDATALLRTAWFDAVDLCRADPAAFAAVAGRRLGGVDVDVADLKGLRVPDRGESDRLVTGGLREPARRLARAMREADIADIGDDVVNGLWAEAP
jgi:NitT/TauT family transport system substrate-binding protein